MQPAVHSLFVGVDANAFPKNAQFVHIGSSIAAPHGFEDCWTSMASPSEVKERPWFNESSLPQVSVIVLVHAGTADQDFLNVAAELGRHLRENPFIAPPVLLLPLVGCASRQVAEALLRDNIVDDVLVGTSRGSMLAFAVDAKLRHVTAQLSALNLKFVQRSRQAAEARKLQASVHFANWQYLRSKVFRAIPPVQPHVPEDSRSIAGIALRSKLSCGFFGSVYFATRQVPEAGVQDTVPACSMQVIDKAKPLPKIVEMHMLNNYLSILQQLDDYAHPNISHLITVIHTRQRLCICTEICGTSTLFIRLMSRDMPEDSMTPQLLTPAAIRAVARQSSAAAQHLHEVVGMCHRDIKPENFMFSQSEDGDVQLKLSGFELAMVTRKNRLCRTSCGTLPFTAPEAITPGKEGYSGALVDMWSLGVLFLELGCGIRCLDRRLEDCGSTLANDQPAAREGAARELRELFMAPDTTASFFDQAKVATASEVRPWLEPIVEGLLRVDPAARLSPSVALALLGQ